MVAGLVSSQAVSRCLTLMSSQPGAPKSELRSNVWSSETLVAGAAAVAAQPGGLLVKDEEDQQLVDEFHVS